MNIKEIRNKIINKEILNKEDAIYVMTELANGSLSQLDLHSLVFYYIINPISIEEIEGYRSVLLNNAIPVNLAFDAIDVCGTGGDGKNTFNISTISAFVIAASGYKVCKHGNYGFSSLTGSSSILEYLEVPFSKNNEEVNDSLDKYNLAFLHAPMFHPALKHVASTRKEIGIRTFFNTLGPLINPGKPSHQLIGVYNLSLLRMYNYFLQKEKAKYSLVHSIDGYDEISLTNKFLVKTNEYEKEYLPNELGFKLLHQSDLEYKNTIEDAAKIFIDVLSDTATNAQKNVVIANCGFGIATISGKPIEESIFIAKETIESKRGLELLKKIKSKKYAYA
ncbi:MAG: anthranilate phosphoribosyltransferase [Bacteroidia bacterium]